MPRTKHATLRLLPCGCALIYGISAPTGSQAAGNELPSNTQVSLGELSTAQATPAAPPSAPGTPAPQPAAAALLSWWQSNIKLSAQLEGGIVINPARPRDGLDFGLTTSGPGPWQIGIISIRLMLTCRAGRPPTPRPRRIVGAHRLGAGKDLGQRAQAASTLRRVLKLPTNRPVRFVRWDLDPAADRTILRCPLDRPVAKMRHGEAVSPCEDGGGMCYSEASRRRLSSSLPVL
jgi:hypothetical protein